jgi:DNA-binding transcriptional LysR family regulator
MPKWLGARPGPYFEDAMNLHSRVDLMTLELYVAAVEERSFAKASERKSIAISAISRRISELEQTFGVLLLHRRHSGIEPTPAGLALLAHARGMLRAAEQLNVELHGYATGNHGLIRIYASESAVFGRVPDLLKTFLDAYPTVRIDFQEATSPRVIAAVAENIADIGIYVGDLPTEGLEHSIFHTDRLSVVVPQSHELAGRSSVRFSDLLDYELIGQEIDSSTETLMRAAAARAGRMLKSRIRVGGFDAACRMVEAGHGISLIAGPIAETLAPAMTLKQIELAETWAVRPHCICVRSSKTLPTVAKRLLNHIVGDRQTGGEPMRLETDDGDRGGTRRADRAPGITGLSKAKS